MSEKMATGVLSDAVNMSGFFKSSTVNSKVGKKFFSKLTKHILFSSLTLTRSSSLLDDDGNNIRFVMLSKLLEEINVMAAGLVSQKHGEDAANVTKEGLDAAGHAIVAAWAVFKIWKALYSIGAIKPTTLAKAAAQVQN